MQILLIVLQVLGSQQEVPKLQGSECRQGMCESQQSMGQFSTEMDSLSVSHTVNHMVEALPVNVAVAKPKIRSCQRWFTYAMHLFIWYNGGTPRHSRQTPPKQSYI